MSVGVEAAYAQGLTDFAAGKHWDECPGDFTETEQEMWQVAFDSAAEEEWTDTDGDIY